ncbi:ABC-ATPase domain-containing protein [Schaalia sp. 19OD2882]|uniref:ABC-ATPase domain-containing protein n=1 Tax=Schaalia sp. 19OD2882 TaxID=2794089 RepID=UPI001C1EFB6A|nr:ABC-ATPase domain-containing protein [Schaalia sp. 19OD2882]QWW19547.1 ABC-ATPase domain-containing protein [Schaalia sp. 19OD2882]
MSPRPAHGSHHSRSPRSGGQDRPIRHRSGSDADLIAFLHDMDGSGYGAYRGITGSWDYGDFVVHVDRVQSDPYAPPSSLRVTASTQRAGLPDEALATADTRLATADFLARAFGAAIARLGENALSIARTGQEILQRSSATVTTDRVQIRFQVQLPARGRTVQGHRAARIMDQDVPDVVMETLDFVTDSARTTAHREALLNHVRALVDHRALQAELVEHGWVAFVADGSVLARRSGVSQLPMSDAVPFTSPQSLRASVTLPHAGEVAGMALAPGVTLVVGGGFHGKSTLLGAIQRGIHPHVPGDGRELVATLPEAMKVRAADGRAVTGVDVSPFITHLPGGADTTRFSTENASGSTSQAAAIMEAVELGCPLLLVDEDTSATNLLIRDARMRALVADESEPITPLVDRIRSLADAGGVSTIMVMGGSGDYLDVADRVLMLESYRCLDVTDRAREVVASMPRDLAVRGAQVGSGDRSAPPSGDEGGAATSPWVRAPRIPMRSRGRAERPRTKAQGLDTVVLDKQTIDLGDLEQIVDPGQTEAIAWALRGVLEHLADARTPVPLLLERLERQIRSEGLDTMAKFGAREYPAFLVRPRMVDVGAALNRYRALVLAP